MLRTHFAGLLASVTLLVAGTGCPGAAESDLLAAFGLVDVALPAAGGADNLDNSAFEQRLQDQFPGCGEPIDAATMRAEVLRLVNEARAIEGLRPVAPDETLQQQAEQYACEMISYEFFGHENPVSGSTLATRSSEFGYDYLVIGENLAAGQTTPEQVFADWMNSPAHRDNIMDPRFSELGVAVRSGGPYRLYWVQEFGLPRLVASPPDPQTAADNP